MGESSNGRMFAIPRSRRLTWDLLHFHKSVPLCAHDRRVNLQALAEARTECAVRISWPALFLKAYALVAKEVPQLRQTWYRWPFAHIYQHPCSVGIITVQRQFRKEPWLFWGNLAHPEDLSIAHIQEYIDTLKTETPKSCFRDQIRLASLPTIIRRLIWFWNLNVCKSKRSHRLGTFFLSTISGQGAEIQLPPSVQTGCLTFGPVTDSGDCRVTLAYDHRLLDGSLVAACLRKLETTLLQTVRSEVLQLSVEQATMREVA